MEVEVHLREYINVIAMAVYVCRCCSKLCIKSRDEDRPLTLMWFHNFLKICSELEAVKQDL